MFRSFQKIHRFVGKVKYHLVDDRFEEVGEELSVSGIPQVNALYIVIKIYERRNLPVLHNLALAIKWLSSYASIHDIVSDNIKHNPLYTKYADDVEKYLMLI